MFCKWNIIKCFYSKQSSLFPLLENIFFSFNSFLYELFFLLFIFLFSWHLLSKISFVSLKLFIYAYELMLTLWLRFLDSSFNRSINNNQMVSSCHFRFFRSEIRSVLSPGRSECKSPHSGTEFPHFNKTEACRLPWHLCNTNC